MLSIAEFVITKLRLQIINCIVPVTEKTSIHIVLISFNINAHSVDLADCAGPAVVERGEVQCSSKIAGRKAPGALIHVHAMISKFPLQLNCKKNFTYACGTSQMF